MVVENVLIGAGRDECRRNFADDGHCDYYYDDGSGEGEGVFKEEVLGLLHAHRLLRL